MPFLMISTSTDSRKEDNYMLDSIQTENSKNPPRQKELSSRVIDIQSQKLFEFRVDRITT